MRMFRDRIVTLLLAKLWASGVPHHGHHQGIPYWFPYLANNHDRFTINPFVLGSINKIN